jgi:hypothetical protein
VRTIRLFTSQPSITPKTMRMRWFEYRDAMAYDFTDLELFLQVVDQGSITQGAERALFATSVALLVRSTDATTSAAATERGRQTVVRASPTNNDPFSAADPVSTTCRGHTIEGPDAPTRLGLRRHRLLGAQYSGKSVRKALRTIDTHIAEHIDNARRSLKAA